MKNPIGAFAKARRLAGAGRPLAALLVLQKAIARVPPAKKPKTIAKRPTTSPAPPASPVRNPPGSFVRARFGSPSGSIHYKLYTPQGSARRRMPLVVMLHGCGQSADDFAVGTGMNALADEMGFVVLYPEQSATANLGRCWNWHRAADQKRGTGEAALIAALTRHAMAAGRINPARVYIAGLSAGGAAAAVVASAHPELFAAVGVHSGLVHHGVATLGGAISAMRTGDSGANGPATRPPLPTIVFHGDRDTIVHPANAAGFLKHLRRSSRRPLTDVLTHGRASGGRAFTRTLHHHADGAVLLESWVVHGSGHAWSGGNRAGSHTDPAGPDASREMLRFFLARRKDTAPARGRTTLS